MLFNSNVFLFVFLPLVLAATLVLRHTLGARAALAGLVGASLFFYGWWNPALVGLILASIAANRIVAGRIEASPAARGRKAWLVAGVTLDLGALGYFKYANFFVANLEAWTGSPIAWEPVALPIAISFFTFQQIAYLVDTSRGRGSGGGLLDYALFVSFFPQLIAGPIVHHRELIPQLRRAHALLASANDLAVGTTILAVGLFKKTVIADGLARIATPVFVAADGGATPVALDAWGAALAYAFQIYFDFSGYSDMAIGLARMFGLQLPINFESPYKAASIVDFWRRWHITLSRFLRDYLYIPLGGNRKGRTRRYANLLATMLLGGLWHGAGWNFLLWGGLHGALLVVNHLWRGWRGVAHPHPRGLARAGCIALTFVVTVVVWVPFRAETHEGTVRMWSAMLAPAELGDAEDLDRWTRVARRPDGPNATDDPVRLPIGSFERSAWRFWILEPFDVELGGLLWLALCAVVVWGLPNTRQWMADQRAGIPTAGGIDDVPPLRLPHWRPTAAWALFTAVLAFASILMIQEGLREFIYFQF